MFIIIYRLDERGEVGVMFVCFGIVIRIFELGLGGDRMVAEW